MNEDPGKIAAIIVTYNRFTLLTECIEALENQTFSQFDILIVDNASTDGTGEKLQSFIDQGAIRYFNTGDNLGGAGGYNYGIRRAYELGYDYFWLMDDDTIPSNTALEKLLTAGRLLNNDYGFLCSNVVWTDGSVHLQNGGQRSEWWREFPHLDEGIMPVDKATFVSFFVPRSIVAQVGLPIKEFFIWADDIDYCLRIIKIKPGYAVFRSKVVHKTPANIDTNIVLDRAERIPRYFYEYRNRLVIARMEHDVGGYFWRVFKRFGRIMISSKDHKLLRIRYMMKGMLYGVFFHPEIEYIDNNRDVSSP